MSGSEPLVTALDLSSFAALGAIGLLTLNILLGLLIATKYNPVRRWPHRRINTVRLHNWTGYVALALALVHPALLLFSATAKFGVADLLWPLGAPKQPVVNTFGALALYLLVLVIVTSVLWQERRAMSRRAWKRLHLATYAMFPLYAVHAVLTDPALKDRPIDYLDGEKVFVELCVLVVIAAIAARVRWQRRQPPPRVHRERDASRIARAAAILLVASLVSSCRSAVPPSSREPGMIVSPPRLVPAPASMTVHDGAPFVIGTTTAIVAADSGARTVAEILARQLRPATGLAIPVVTSAPATGAHLTLLLDPSRTALGAEGYELEVSATAVRLRAATGAGLFHGVQTIRQLLPLRIESDMRIARTSWTMPPLTITDVPRFAWRGAMLDVSRHFFTAHEVQQFIDLLALYKMNVLHLHLSDDQGWRIEIRSRPLLASVGGASQVGGGAGGFYTQEEYASLVRYAADRHVTIVPEIDMPGHTNAALTAYPALACSRRATAQYTGTEVGWSTLCVDKEETYALVEDVIRELAAMTPGEFLHIGGDEVEALTPEQYARFIERTQDIVARHGKRMIGWEEVAHAKLAPTSVAQHWRSDSVVKALRYGAKVVLSPARRAYLDMKYDTGTELGLRWAGFVGLRSAYDWDPATQIAGLGERDVLGVEAPIWSETLRNITAVQYLAVPRLPALAEVGWTPQGARSWESFRGRLAAHAGRWRLLGINYHPTIEVDW